MSRPCQPSQTSNDRSVTGDRGEVLTFIDVVGRGGHPSANQLPQPAGSRVDEPESLLVELHRQQFPAYPEARADIVEDARAPSQRDDITIHQLLCLVDGAAAGFILFDSNALRGLGVVHFAAVGRAGRSVRVDGRSLAETLVSRALATVAHDLRGDFAGLVGESPSKATRLWRRMGFRVLPIEYAEPLHGRRWFDHLGSTPENAGPAPVSALDLVWLPRRRAEVPLPERVFHDVAHRAAAAYLLDHYRLDADHPLVVGLFGSAPGLGRAAGRAVIGRP